MLLYYNIQGTKLYPQYILTNNYSVRVNRKGTAMKLKDIESIWVYAWVTSKSGQEENTPTDLVAFNASSVWVNIKQPGFNCIGRRKKLSVKVLADGVKKAIIKRLDPTTFRTEVTVVGMDVRTKRGKEVSTQVEFFSGDSWRWNKDLHQYRFYELKPSRTK